jgi:hypothetical protein
VENRLTLIVRGGWAGVSYIDLPVPVQKRLAIMILYLRLALRDSQDDR